MKFMGITEAFAFLCKLTGKWGLYLQTSSGYCKGDWFSEVEKATLLPQDEALTLGSEGEAILLFDNETDCRTAYSKVVGDDGPTKANPYAGSMRVYALICDSTGEPRTENT